MKKEIKIVGTLDEIELEFLVDQVNLFIERLYQEMSNGFHARSGGEIDKDTALLFFRSKERMDNLKMLLQYLVYFAHDVSFKSLSHPDLILPYCQFKSFIQDHISLLKEEDVRHAIMREYVQLLPLEQHSLTDFKVRISEQFHRLTAMVNSAPIPTPDNFFKLFDALRQFSRYWFELKSHHNRRIRRSDFYIYKFSRLLLEKYMN